jgi:hypothetical protein
MTLEMMNRDDVGKRGRSPLTSCVTIYSHTYIAIARDLLAEHEPPVSVQVGLDPDDNTLHLIFSRNDPCFQIVARSKKGTENYACMMSSVTVYRRWPVLQKKFLGRHRAERRKDRIVVYLDE